VNVSPALRWLLVLLLPLTLAWKLVSRPADPNKIRNDIVVFLERHDFNTLDSRKPLVDIQIIEARSVACRLLVGNISPYGVHTDIVQQLGTAADRRFFVFRGIVYQQQPVVLTAVNHLGFRFLHDLGLVSAIPPVLALVSSCDAAAHLPWGELRFSD
jgi:hypothetical protein